MPFRWRFWKRKEKKKTRDVDSAPPADPPIANSSTLAYPEPSHELPPHQLVKSMEDRGEENHERGDNNADSALSSSRVMDNDMVVGVTSQRVFEPHDHVSMTMAQADQHLSPPGQATAQMFTSASNVAISGGNFIAIGSQTIVHGPDDEARLKAVYDTAAPNAILNAGGRADEVRCHPGTREEVLAKSEAWMEPPADQQLNKSRKGIFWLSGPAGAGKSAIMQTLAERRQARGLPMVNFFFFRNDSTRSNAGPLVATILTQLFDLYPDLKALISAVLREKPNILRQSLRDQFQHLIDNPIRTLRAAYPSLIQHPIVLLIDGLDECSSESATKREQQSLLKILHGLVSREDSPFVIFVASRPEPHLTMAFNEVGSSVDSIFLDEDYHPANDIRIFVVAELEKIKRTHQLGSMLAPNWPTDNQIDSVVDKSSGQFIYAATVIRFISGSPASPAFSLDIVHSLRPRNRASPFVELDAIYSFIFSQVDDWKSTKDVLTAHCIRKDSEYPRPPALSYFLSPLGYAEDDLPSLVSALPALVKLGGGELTLYHASLTDFLRDKSRSGDYSINIQEFCDTWALVFVRCIWDDDSLCTCNIIIEQVSGPSLSITEALQSFPTLGFQFAQDGWVRPVHFMGKTLHDYCRNDDKLYKELVQLWISWFRKNRTIFKEESDTTDPYFVYQQSIKSQLEQGVWEEIIRSSKADEESRGW